LAGFDSRVEIEELYNWDGICSRLARQAPWWEPGTASGYHAITQGYLQGEILRRVDGRSLGTFFREEIAIPLNIDFHIGLDTQHDDRVGEMVPPSTTMDQIPGDPDSVATRTFRSAVLTGREPQTRAWRTAEIPAAGGIGNARAVARVHGALAAGGTLEGVRLMAPETVAMAQQQQTNGKDLVLGVWMLFGMGFGLMNPRNPFTPSPGAFYWGGWGGSIAVVDPDTRTSIAYVMNRMGLGAAVQDRLRRAAAGRIVCA
jgi:CubicO group peptidase (beta-lactamase class C family)